MTESNRAESMTMRNDVEQYNEIESWCKHEIASGSDFLFDPVLFQQTLEVKSSEWGFAYEVGSIVAARRSHVGRFVTG